MPTYARRKMALKNLTTSGTAEGHGASRSGGRWPRPSHRVRRARRSRGTYQLLFLPERLCAAAKTLNRCEASRLRLAVLAFALAGYRSDHGRYPPSLKDLSPAYIAEIPKIPLPTRSRLSHSGHGYLLYSVGPNGRDDGGRNMADDGDKWLHETDPSKIPDYDDIAIRTPEETAMRPRQPASVRTRHPHHSGRARRTQFPASLAPPLIPCPRHGHRHPPPLPRRPERRAAVAARPGRGGPASRPMPTCWAWPPPACRWTCWRSSASNWPSAARLAPTRTWR